VGSGLAGENLLAAASLLLTVTAMPKMKTHKASKKRFRVTASGKLKRRQAGKKHLLSHKTGTRKRHLRAPVIETDKSAIKYVELMGGKA
jgi:large subunit ribosomal protein L35